MVAPMADPHAHPPPRPTPPPLAAPARLGAILGGAAGNFIEWYDWFVYASFSVYFAPAFFPSGNLVDQRLQAAAVFAVGFVARPLGAWLTGVFADAYGRRRALVLSISAMCAGSLAIAVMPAAGRIGIWAAVLLTAARLVQGLSLGGEYGASATYISEMAGKGRRGFWSSFQFITIVGGQIAALGVLLALQGVLSEAQLKAFGWRVPFVIGAALSVVVFLIQSRLEETQAFAREGGRLPGSRTLRLLRAHPREVAVIFVMSGAGALIFYSFTTYMQKFLSDTAHFSKPVAARIAFGSLVLFLLVQPIFGLLGDRFGRRLTLIFAFAGGALFSFPALVLLARTHDALAALGLISLVLVFLAGYSAVNAVVKAELLPTPVRALGVSLPYALANAVFGGTAELVAEAFRKAGLESGFYAYVSVAAAAGLVAALLMPRPATDLIEG